MGTRIISEREAQDLIRLHLTVSFRRAFGVGLRDAYRQAEVLCRDVDPPERSRVLGYNRWALSEKALRTAGRRSAEVEVEGRTAGGGFPYVALISGPVLLTQSHVAHRTDLPRESEFRVELAATSQMALIPPVGDPETRLYVVAVHGTEDPESKGSAGPDFVRLIVPTPGFDDVLTFVDVPLPLVGRARPKTHAGQQPRANLKKKRKEEDEGTA